jgi:hypothetical protein
MSCPCWPTQNTDPPMDSLSTDAIAGAMDVSQSSSISLRSTGLPKCMIIRSTKDANILARERKSKKLYLQRLEQRLKDAGKESFNVAFDSVEVREYPMILGFNPAVSHGPPLEIDWNHIDEEKWNFESYEETRPIRRTYAEMNMPMELRVEILERNGVLIKDIRSRSKEVKALRIKRLETTQTLYRRKTHERLEKFSRRLKNIFSDKKSRERDLLEKTKSLSQLPIDADEESFMRICDTIDSLEDFDELEELKDSVLNNTEKDASALKLS